MLLPKYDPIVKERDPVLLPQIVTLYIILSPSTFSTFVNIQVVRPVTQWTLRVSGWVMALTMPSPLGAGLRHFFQGAWESLI